EMLDLELGVLLRQLAAAEAVDDLALYRAEAIARRIDESANRDHRETRIELRRWHRIPRCGADEGALEARMGDRFVGADKPRPELNPGRAHFEIGQHRFAAP